MGNWTDKDKTGIGFDSSTVFILPNGARKGPDASWLKLDRWSQLTPDQQDGFPPIVPDFVIELVSPSDLKNQRYSDLQDKMTSDPASTEGARERARMQEYLANGVKLGWLIEPKGKTVEIYRQGQAAEVLQNPQSLSGEKVLSGFILDLTYIFN